MPEDRWEALRTLPREVVPPTYADIVHTARRRRTGAVLGVAAVVVLALGASSLGVALTNDDAVRPAHSPRKVQTGPPSPTASVPVKTPGHHGLTAAQIVNSPRAVLFGLAVSPDDPDVRATLWGLCPRRACGPYREAVALTDDGFATARYIRVSSLSPFEWCGTGVIVRAASGTLALISPTAPARSITVSARSEPLTGNERLVASGDPTRRGFRYLAVDPRAATAHPIPVPYPRSSILQLVQSRGTTVWGTLSTNKIVSSADGGASWQPIVNPSGLLQLDPIDSAAPGILAFIEAGDDDSRQAGSLLRSTDDGASWQQVRPPGFANASASWAAVTPTGRLLVYVFGHFSGTAPPVGLYESDSASWLTFHRVPDGQDGDLKLASVNPSGHQSLYLYNQTGLHVSTDEARTWHVIRAR